ncbi:hypothetical protein KUTeg_018746 [Tegillarca granosa]|uniref:Uncharacterized protein n=1 Tax=Tegillarca granosa TaxID=220873 RepID=A0ABQ9EKD4_TEGGR|nr:hypothetical protein KUTeg_018746 [Tegillarca granosa]
MMNAALEFFLQMSLNDSEIISQNNFSMHNSQKSNIEKEFKKQNFFLNFNLFESTKSRKKTLREGKDLRHVAVKENNSSYMYLHKLFESDILLHPDIYSQTSYFIQIFIAITKMKDDILGNQNNFIQTMVGDFSYRVISLFLLCFDSRDTGSLRSEQEYAAVSATTTQQTVLYKDEDTELKLIDVENTTEHIECETSVVVDTLSEPKMKISLHLETHSSRYLLSSNDDVSYSMIEIIGKQGNETANRQYEKRR